MNEPDLIQTGPGWLVADKPWGMSVHNAPGRDLCSRIAQRVRDDPILAGEIRHDPGFGIHPVHRLDADTSGVILLACRRDIFRQLAAQFQAATVVKRYHALVHGLVNPPQSGMGNGLWEFALSRDAGGRKNPRGRPPFKPCRTRYRVLAHGHHYTLISCRPLTGRKHQIRRHAKLAGHPVVGDSRYGSRRSLDFLAEHAGYRRLGLHAMALTFAAPEKSDPVTVQSTGLPWEMVRLFETDHPDDQEEK